MIICFDLDGTLVDTHDWNVDAELKSFIKNGIKVKRNQLYDMWGMTLKDQIKIISPKIKKEKIEQIRRDFEKERENTLEGIKPYKNTKKILKRLSKKYCLCLLSNNTHKKIEWILEQTKIDKKLFKLIVGYDDVKRAKPFPDEIYKAEKELKKKVQFMVGDSLQDIKTAESSKVKSVIILTSPKQVWKDLKEADYKIKDIKELPKLIKEVTK